MFADIGITTISPRIAYFSIQQFPLCRIQEAVSQHQHYNFEFKGEQKRDIRLIPQTKKALKPVYNKKIVIISR